MGVEERGISWMGMHPKGDKKRPLNLNLHPGLAPYPTYGLTRKLFCRTGWFLALYPDGMVRGTRELFDRYSVFEFSSHDVGEIRMLGVAARMYVSMNKKGRLFGQEDARDEGTIFHEKYSNGYNVYLNRKYACRGWFLGIKKSGKPKAGKNTWWSHRAVQFLPWPVSE